MEHNVERRETTKKLLRPMFANFKPEIAIELIRLAVLYEDLRIEYRSIMVNDLGDSDQNGSAYRRLYFHRRIYLSLNEFQDALHSLSKSSEFCDTLRSDVRWPQWGAALEFFKKHDKTIRDRRNMLGGHFGPTAARHAFEMMQVHDTSGQMALYLFHDITAFDAAHMFALELATLPFFAKVTTDEAGAFSKEAGAFVQEALRHAANAFTVISSRHFLPFFNERWPAPS